MPDSRNFPIGTATVSWVDSEMQAHLRVYSSDGYNVIERCHDGDHWFDGEFTAPGSNVSATCWQEKDGVHLRVFCTFQDKTVEWCNDGNGWQQGDYTTS